MMKSKASFAHIAMALVVVDGVGVGIHVNVAATTSIFVRHIFLLYCSLFKKRTEFRNSIRTQKSYAKQSSIIREIKGSIIRALVSAWIPGFNRDRVKSCEKRRNFSNNFDKLGQKLLRN